VERRGLKAFLDTHAALLLWEGRLQSFGSDSRHFLDRAMLLLSPIVRLELAFLRETGKVEPRPSRVLQDLAADLGVLEVDTPLHEVVACAESLSWTRDPFDRLIVATALFHEAPLVTRDARISEHFSAAVW
jgi:PIN domain nuclease of toxin-antitoxin system